MEKNILNISKRNLRTYVGISVFSALAYIVALICNIIPPVAGFLSLDVKDAVIAMASFVYGPVSAVIIAFLAALIELLTFSTTGWYGFVMNFVSSAVFSLVASLIYKKYRSIDGALMSFLFAVVATTCIMLFMNTFITPLYLAYIGVPLESAKNQVVDMLPKILLPFNFAKALLNSAVAMLLYKPLTLALVKAKLIQGKGTVNFKFNKNSVIIITAGVIALIVAVMIIISI